MNRNITTVFSRGRLIAKFNNILYNTMMRRVLSSTALLVLLFFPSGVGAQYLTPEDVLIRDQNAILVPKNKREAQEAADAQDAARAAQHRSTLQENSSEPVPENNPPVPTEEPLLRPSAPEEPEGYTQELDPITLRLLERLRRESTQTLSSTALHSGAPLADTGPAEIMSVLTIIVAIGWTVRRSTGMKGMIR